MRWATATRTTRCQRQEPARLAMRRCGTWAKHAGVPLRRVRAVEGAGRLFSTPSRPALRPGSDPTVTGEPASPSTPERVHASLSTTLNPGPCRRSSACPTATYQAKPMRYLGGPSTPQPTSVAPAKDHASSARCSPATPTIPRPGGGRRPCRRLPRQIQHPARPHPGRTSHPPRAGTTATGK
jgi:hypothetical protein